MKRGIVDKLCILAIVVFVAWMFGTLLAEFIDRLFLGPQ